MPSTTQYAEPEFSPDWSQVSPASWDALKRYASDEELMWQFFEAMKRAGRFEQWIAAPAIAAELIHDSAFLALSEKERVDTAHLLAALITARFELHVHETMGEWIVEPDKNI